jgi:hypothetical protein
MSAVVVICQITDWKSCDENSLDCGRAVPVPTFRYRFVRQKDSCDTGKQRRRIAAAGMSMAPII